MPTTPALRGHEPNQRLLQAAPGGSGTVSATCGVSRCGGKMGFCRIVFFDFGTKSRVVTKIYQQKVLISPAKIGLNQQNWCFLKGNIRNSTSIHSAFAWQKYELAAGGNSSSTCGGMARLHPGIFWGRFQKKQTQQLFVAFVLKNDELQHTGKMGKRQRECQRKCQIECQMNCLNIRQIQCHIKGQIECQKNIILLTYKFTSFFNVR